MSYVYRKIVRLSEDIKLKQGSHRLQTRPPVLPNGELRYFERPKSSLCVRWPATGITAQCTPFIAKPKAAHALRSVRHDVEQLWLSLN